MTTQSMTDTAEIARLNDEINAACIAKDMRTAYTKLQERREVERGRRSLTAALVAGVVLALSPVAADAAVSEIGTPATLGVPVTHVAKIKPASKALLAKAVAHTLADVKAKVAADLAAGASFTATYSHASCRGTTKRIVCKATSIQTMAAPFVETFHVSHGKFTSVGGPIINGAPAGV